MSGKADSAQDENGWLFIGVSRAINCLTINRGKILHCLLEESKNPRRKIFDYLFFGLKTRLNEGLVDIKETIEL